jgi:hypothetical protein
MPQSRVRRRSAVDGVRHLPWDPVERPLERRSNNPLIGAQALNPEELLLPVTSRRLMRRSRLPPDPPNALLWVRKAVMPTQKLTSEIITAAIEGFGHQRTRIDQQIAELRALLSGVPVESTAKPEAPTGKRKKFSAAARKRMKEAQQRRWARIKGESEPLAPAKVEPTKPKRKLSAAGRKAIQEALRRRWALKRAESAKVAPKKAIQKKTAKKAGSVKRAVKDKATASTPAVAEAAAQ